MPTIHPTAVLSARTQLADDVVIGPHVVTEGHVEIGPRTVVRAQSFIQGHTRIGADCQIGPAAYVGTDAQHLTYDRSQPTWLIVGDRCIVRETATLHRASRPGVENATSVGDRCFVMGAATVGHDCRIADGVIVAHAVLLAGHVTVAERAFLGGGCGIHQYVRIGRLAIVGGNETPTRDIPPFAALRWGGLKGYNAIGCKRSGMPRESIAAVRKAFHCYHTHRTRPAVLKAIRETCPPVPEVQHLIEFIETTKRGVQPSFRFLHHATAGDADGE
jgi:UDP-N-acetylglucosamine acyltransferase